MALERKVPVHRSEFHLIDQEFRLMRERFESEMSKMEDEMNKFRSHLMNRESSVFGPSAQIATQSPSTGGDALWSEFHTWLDDLNSPLVQDSDDGKVLKLRFDVTQYAPEEIVVKTVDNRIQVHAKHEEKDDHRRVYREYNREFLLPKGTNPEMIRSALSKDGVLTVEAPLPAIEGGHERRVPIDNK